MINITNARTLERVYIYIYIYIYIDNFIELGNFNQVTNVMFTNECKQSRKNYIVQQADTQVGKFNRKIKSLEIGFINNVNENER